jgi:hypothetical protein
MGTLSHSDMETLIRNRKRKPRGFSLICFTFAHRAKGILVLVHLLMKKQTEGICLKAD